MRVELGKYVGRLVVGWGHLPDRKEVGEGF